MLRKHSIVGIASALTIGASATFAATSTGTLGVTAIVVDACIVAATPMAFIDIDGSAATNQTTPGVITVTCTSAKTGVTITLDGGLNEDTGQRNMTSINTTTDLPYNIYTDSGHTAEVAVGGEIFNGDIPAVIPEIITVYGQIPSGAYGADLLYGDTVTITVDYP
ncbi:spore coat U domain-containing protein [Shimia sp. FJ5]|uniref:Csu type fimbrial protein n=1 Tax=Shimia sp. FJ5 TaxID=3079054 RepID=UPI0026074A59|nr:spore coat U domain-containing protein [Shimia sp. FJ5]MDV4145676.1 spore coat U domain-containing protein [Shimia sp. FJ5]